MLNRIFQLRASSTLPAIPEVTGLLEKLYQDQVAQQHIQYDEVQYSALHYLQHLMENLLAIEAFENKPPLQKLLTSPPEKCQHLYIFGGVGRGKSMLMDLFYDACPLKNKRRVHFHAFMLEVHEYTHQWRQHHSGDVIADLAAHIRKSAMLICFDELQVTDIADAMILGRLFTKLFALGTAIVTTSNRHPDDLYKDGLQRELFLPFISLLKETSHILELKAREDYRLSHLHALETTYYYPINAQSENFIQLSCDEFTHCAPLHPVKLHVFGRDINLVTAHGDILLTSFAELCEQALGAADYLEIACEFTTIIMARIPKLTAAKRNEAKRFATLIDALYEHKVKFICSAEVPADQLYTQGKSTFEFQRTASRLMEMQTENYFHSAHVSE